MLSRPGEALAPNAVQNDAEQNDDHPDEADQVRRELGGGVLMLVPGMSSRLEMGGDVGEPAQDHDHQTDPGDDRQADELLKAGL